jgi:outer membrane murein-binding lipoprotein Lpp
MGMIEIGGIASALVAVITLITKIIKLITTIQSLINRLDQLQKDMNTTRELWEDTSERMVSLDQRLRHIEYELAIV